MEDAFPISLSLSCFPPPSLSPSLPLSLSPSLPLSLSLSLSLFVSLFFAGFNNGPASQPSVSGAALDDRMVKYFYSRLKETIHTLTPIHTQIEIPKIHHNNVTNRV